MKIEKIEYSKNYNIQGMQWEKIVMGGTLEEGESEMDAIVELRKKCDQSAQQISSQLYDYQPLVVNPPETFFVRPEPEEKLTPDQETEALLLAISEANATELPQYQLVAAKNQKTMGAYNKRKKQLNVQ